eukprot:TRINITY_DN735_c0_g1_i1.p1 TRINITY_DN735_c0_g1~~TRINITY_DN735_c0_g1_i1.p1  ORF type:complete len:534 (-),score=229.98 TRINITY_DN735_c0_g1_i1:52-1653(-)
MPPKRKAAAKDEESSSSQKEPSSMTIPQIKAEIESLGFEHSSCKRKADYVECLTNARQGKGEKAGEEQEEEEEPEKVEEKPAKKGKTTKKEEKKEEEQVEEKPTEKVSAKTEEKEEKNAKDEKVVSTTEFQVENLYSTVLGTKATSTKHKGEKFSQVWYETESLYILDSPEIKGSKKIYGFDMDGTLVNPKNPKAKFPTGRNDWTWILADGLVKSKLQEAHKDGYKIVIFTNQAGIEKGKTQRNHIEGKILDLSVELGFPLQAFVASATDVFRKPHPTMWDYMIKYHNGGVVPDLSQCAYIGDAAGRPKTASRPKDFSCGDRTFAHNIGIKFYTPEMFYEGSSDEPFEWDGPDPNELIKKFGANPEINDKFLNIPTTQEVVVLTGSPASGKSTFAKRYFVSKGYTWINNDALNGNAKKGMKLAEEALANGKSVIFDNTNPSTSKRGELLDLANTYKAPARSFWIDTPLEVAHHNNLYREKVASIRRIPDVGFNMFKKNFSEPSTKEGFTECKKLSFFPKFDSDELKKLFLQRT